MKKILCILLILASLLSLASCGEDYEPIESTDEEARVVMTLSFEGEAYEVRYELYRTMFLTYRDAVDGGNRDVWSGDDSSSYKEKIHAMIVKRVTDIYAALHLCKRIGIDLYSNEVEKEIKEYIKAGVEGGVYEGEAIGGYESYDDYLEALAKRGFNYSVQELVLRYGIAIDRITAYYAGTVENESLDDTPTGGALSYTKEDVKSFYDGEDSVRVMSAFVQSSYEGALGRAERLREKMLDAAGDDKAVAIVILSNSISVNEDIENGSIIGKFSLDEENYGAMTEAAFSTPVGRVSDIVEIRAGEEPGYYIFYTLEKSDAHFDECYEEISEVYVENVIGSILFEIQAALTDSVAETELLNSLDYSAITYPTVERNK